MKHIIIDIPRKLKVSVFWLLIIFSIAIIYISVYIVNSFYNIIAVYNKYSYRSGLTVDGRVRYTLFPTSELESVNSYFIDGCTGGLFSRPYRLPEEMISEDELRRLLPLAYKIYICSGRGRRLALGMNMIKFSLTSKVFNISERMRLCEKVILLESNADNRSMLYSNIVVYIRSSKRVVSMDEKKKWSNWLRKRIASDYAISERKKDILYDLIDRFFH